MPFTPYHMGPGILFKALLQGSFSLMVFGWAQVMMDLQPLIAIVSENGRLHGFSHTYLGATIIAIFSAGTGKYLAQWALVNIIRLRPVVFIGWLVAFLSAFIGTYSHVILDSIMHGDVQPWFPFSASNNLLGLASVQTLHKLCLYGGLVGTVSYFIIARILRGREIADKPSRQA
ncbi:MAG: hypothetical protein V4628_13650 [Pseudomonadota bacterium]